MSFASEAKKEITQKEIKECCAVAELVTLIRMNGSLIESTNKIYLDIQTENAAIARRIYSLVRRFYTLPIELLVRKKMRLKKNNVYIVRLKEEPVEFLKGLGVYHGGKWIDGIPYELIGKTCCKRSCLRGAFLAGGSVNNPETSSYHLEIYNDNERIIQDLCDIMQGFELNSRILERKKGFITYLKEAEKITGFLSIVGAVQSLLKFEDVRIVRDMRNSVNRLVNCETANLNKTISAAFRQMENIRYIQRTIGLDALPGKLREIAEVRIQHEDVSLKELGEMLPSGTISKSGINHRLKKIDEIADRIRGEKLDLGED